MGIYDRDYMKRGGDQPRGETGTPASLEARLEAFARHVLARKKLLKILGITLVVLILIGLLLTLF